MGIKRKASFTTITVSSAAPFCSNTVVTIDETPKHLHSRTRKRFRNDRPDDQTVYEHTIRLLFSAPKKQLWPSPLPTEEPETPCPTVVESVDPRQQTLRKFFQPVKSLTPSMQVKSIQQKNEVISNFQNYVKQDPSEGDLVNSRIESSAGIALRQETDMDVDMNIQAEIMDTNQPH